VSSEIDTQDIKALAARVDKESPDPDDIEELRSILRSDQSLWRRVGDLTVQNQKKLIKDTEWAKSAELAVNAALRAMRLELGYTDAPMIEQLLIENVLLAWLRLNLWEYQFTELDVSEGMILKKAAFWEKRISAGQRRYLRAIETLARVRKITRTTTQINIAEEGSQQLNILGSIVGKKGKKEVIEP
jgi:hypothetical protein